MKEYYLESFDKKKLFVMEFSNTEKPKAVVLIVHGMSEHSKRYTEFAEFLNKNNVVVYVFDLRAHGKTDENSIGIITGDNFSDCVLDVEFMAKYIKEKLPGLSLTVLGHSYGSYVVQSYMQKFNIHNKIILSGSSFFKTLTNRFGLLVANCTATFKGNNAPAKMIVKLSFDSYRKKFKNRCWLSSDPEVTKVYANDNFCNQKFSVGFYRSFFRNGLKLYKKRNIAKIDKAKPVYIFSGAKDPVGGFSKSVKKLDRFYKKHKVNSYIKLYENGRHEILNEINKKDVYEDFLKAITE